MGAARPIDLGGATRTAGGDTLAPAEAAFEAALAFTLRCEGVDLHWGDTGYVNDPDDPGGATNYGITQAVFDAHRRRLGLVSAPVRGIEMPDVREIYRRSYWEAAKCSAFAAERPRLALAHFDAAVNLGVTQAAKCLQRALGVAADGVIGPVTIAAAVRCDEGVVVGAYLRDRARVYQMIVHRRPVAGKFMMGWRARCQAVARATGVEIGVAYA
jgi:lysozyme family protein